MLKFLQRLLFLGAVAAFCGGSTVTLTGSGKPIVASGGPPIIAAISGANNGANTDATLTVTLPATANAGELIVVYATISGNNTFTWSAGYTEILDNSRVGAAYKCATGGETSMQFTQSGTSRSAWISEIISGVGDCTTGTFIQISNATMTSGTSATPDPPSITPSWGTTPTLVTAIARNATASDVITAGPSGYGNFVATGATNDPNIATASLGFDPGATEDPGTFTQGTSAAWLTNTFAIKGQ